MDIVMVMSSEEVVSVVFGEVVVIVTGVYGEVVVSGIDTVSCEVVAMVMGGSGGQVFGAEVSGEVVVSGVDIVMIVSGEQVDSPSL